jgi:hypothetical protein
MLKVPRPLHARFVVNLVQGAAWLGLVGWAAWHYVARVPGPHGLMAYLLPLLFSAPGVWFVVAAVIAKATRRAVSDARVLVLQSELRPGGNVRVRLEQDLLRRAELQRVRVGLVCEKTVGSGRNQSTEVHWQAWTSPDGAPGNGRVVVGPGGSRVILDEVLPIPADQPPSTPEGISARPDFDWKLVAETALAGSPDYRVEFEITVCAPTDGSADVSTSGTSEPPVRSV